MAVPFLDLVRVQAAYQSELESALLAVARSGRYILGHEVAAFEREFAAACQSPYAVGVSSGTDALLLALSALGVGPGDKVLTTPFTFFATAGAVLRLGARPVFADIEEDGFGLDVEKALGALDRTVKAVLPVHLFGGMVKLEALLAPCEELGVPIVEDAAQAVGARDEKGRVAGTLGAAGCFSFFPSKNLGALGDGGAVLCRDAELAERLTRLRVHGSPEKNLHTELGGNHRLDALQAAALRVKLHHLARDEEARRNNARTYAELFRAMNLDGGPLRLPAEGPGRHVFNQYVLRAEKRDALFAHLRGHGIGCEIYYPHPLHLQPLLADSGFNQGAFPCAERAAQDVLALPIFPGLTERELCEVVEVVSAFYQG